MCGVLDLHRDMHRCQWVLKAGLHMHVFRFPYLAMRHFLMCCNHFIMEMEIGFNFLFSAAARSHQLGGEN